jgi:hypothetical protein
MTTLLDGKVTLNDLPEMVQLEEGNTCVLTFSGCPKSL